MMSIGLSNFSEETAIPILQFHHLLTKDISSVLEIIEHIETVATGGEEYHIAFAAVLISQGNGGSH
jgi:hypothetical protein